MVNVLIQGFRDTANRPDEAPAACLTCKVTAIARQPVRTNGFVALSLLVGNRRPVPHST